MSFIETIKSRAKQQIKTIVLPEATDIRTLKATEIVLKEKYADIILVGNKEQIIDIAKTNNINIEEAKIVEKIMPDAGLIILPGTHYAYLENIGQVMNILNSFLGGK